MSRSTIPAKRPADAQEAAWVAGEDRFVLLQAKKKAAIRAKSGRAQPIDWLTVILAVIDPERNPLDDELEDGDLEVVSPEAVFEGLEDAQLAELEKGIDTYQTLEASKSNRDYWMVSFFPADTRSCSCHLQIADRRSDDEDNLSRPTQKSWVGTFVCTWLVICRL